MTMKLFGNILLFLMIAWTSCVDKVNLSLPTNELPLIIEGQVTKGMGPHFVRISKAFPVDGKSYAPVGIRAEEISITDDSGFRDVLRPVIDDTGAVVEGSYQTLSLEGVIGRKYLLEITMPDGLKLESTMETLSASGMVDAIYYDYISGQKNSDGLEEEGFNVYVDATLAPGSSRRLRWKFNGTYKITTDPSAIIFPPPPDSPGPPTTLACAAGCECCTCYVSVHEESPLMNNPTFLGTEQIKRVFIQYVPINNYTFNEKYRIEVAQMELSQVTFDFFDGIRGQTANGSSLFQPPFFELKGNVKAINSNVRVVGVFWAAEVFTKAIFLTRSDVPHAVSIEPVPGDCRAVVSNSTLTVPPFWE
jgi:hypothetical protein